MTDDAGNEETMDDHLKSATLTNSVNNLFNNARISKQKLPPIDVVMRNGVVVGQQQTHPGGRYQNGPSEVLPSAFDSSTIASPLG